MGFGTDFRPLPFLGNPHVQTVLSQCLQGPAFLHPTQQRQVELPDGDGLLLYDSIPPGWQPGDRAVLLLHGLGGCHQSPHVRRLARLLLPRGVRVFRMDLRGAGPGAALARRGYHAGCSADVRAALRSIAASCPGSPLLLAGFSLGGNVALRVAGEATTEPVPGLERVAALGPPIDLDRCVALIGQPWNRLYDRYFVSLLLRQLRERGQHVALPRRLTLRRFDDLVTAPAWGFADAGDYYRQASAGPLIPRIGVPALLVTARDDPFIAVEPFESLTVPPHVEVHIVDRGGHLGFLGRDGAGGIRWAEQRLAAWLTAR
jgi:predicted alpha/beta-fold hydrolase